LDDTLQTVQNLFEHVGFEYILNSNHALTTLKDGICSNISKANALFLNKKWEKRKDISFLFSHCCLSNSMIINELQLIQTP
jgi:hypothetical protein